MEENEKPAPDGVAMEPTAQATQQEQPTLRELIERQKELRKQHKAFEAMAPLLEKLDKHLTSLDSAVLKPEKKAAPQEPEKIAGKIVDVTGLRLAILELDTPVPKDKRALIERLYKSEEPTDVDAWLRETVDALGISKPAPVTAAAVVAEKPKPVTPNGGPPGVDRKAHLPDDLLDPAVGEAMKSMTPQEKRAFYEAYKRKRGMDINVFAEKRSKPLIPTK